MDTSKPPKLLGNDTTILVGPPVVSVLPNKYIVGYYDKGFKGIILTQQGSSDMFVATPTTFRNVINFYWEKFRGR